LANTNDLVLDQYVALSFKSALGNRRAAGTLAVPSWVGEENERRLTAYGILAAYLGNAARFYLNVETESARDDRREYGDASVIVEGVMDALLGDEQTVVVAGSDLAGEQDLLEEPTPPVAGANGVIDQAAQEEYDAALEEFNAAREEAAEAELALARQELLQTWAEDERLILKLFEAEAAAVGLGDAVYSLGWSSQKSRPRLRVWDPGFYFPVLTDGSEDDYPTRVHLAWEIADSPNSEAPADKTRIRRITWELGPIMPLRDAEGEFQFDEEGRPRFADDVTFDEDREEFVRQYPWNADPSNVTCYMTDAIWEIDNLDATIDDFGEARAIYQLNDDGVAIRQLDQNIDFIPVIHIPNTVAEQEHFGMSSLSKILQILDDLATADTDLSAASGTTGSPPITISGAVLEIEDERGISERRFVQEPTRTTKSYGPGTVFETGAEGRMDILDTSKSLDALIKYATQLLERLSVNSRLPASLLGRIKPSEVPSGIALALSFGPLQSMIRKMRLVRREKYRLLLKFVQRFYQLHGNEEEEAEEERTIAEGVEQILVAELALGSYLPQDRTAAVTEATGLLKAKAISRTTAIQILIEAGIPIDDAASEIERIESEDIEAAAALVDATGNVDEAARRLGVEPAEQPTPPPAPEIVPTT
jgi:hypothetical protein